MEKQPTIEGVIPFEDDFKKRKRSWQNAPEKHTKVNQEGYSRDFTGAPHRNQGEDFWGVDDKDEPLRDYHDYYLQQQRQVRKEGQDKASTPRGEVPPLKSDDIRYDFEGVFPDEEKDGGKKPQGESRTSDRKTGAREQSSQDQKEKSRTALAGSVSRSEAFKKEHEELNVDMQDASAELLKFRKAVEAVALERRSRWERAKEKVGYGDEISDDEIEKALVGKIDEERHHKKPSLIAQTFFAKARAKAVDLETKDTQTLVLQKQYEAAKLRYGESMRKVKEVLDGRVEKRKKELLDSLTDNVIRERLTAMQKREQNPPLAGEITSESIQQYRENYVKKMEDKLVAYKAMLRFQYLTLNQNKADREDLIASMSPPEQSKFRKFFDPMRRVMYKTRYYRIAAVAGAVGGAALAGGAAPVLAGGIAVRRLAGGIFGMAGGAYVGKKVAESRGKKEDKRIAESSEQEVRQAKHEQVERARAEKPDTAQSFSVEEQEKIRAAEEAAVYLRANRVHDAYEHKLKQKEFKMKRDSAIYGGMAGIVIGRGGAALVGDFLDYMIGSPTLPAAPIASSSAARESVPTPATTHLRPNSLDRTQGSIINEHPRIRPSDMRHDPVPQDTHHISVKPHGVPESAVPNKPSIPQSQERPAVIDIMRDHTPSRPSQPIHYRTGRLYEPETVPYYKRHGGVGEFFDQELADRRYQQHLLQQQRSWDRFQDRMERAAISRNERLLHFSNRSRGGILNIDVDAGIEISEKGRRYGSMYLPPESRPIDPYTGRSYTDREWWNYTQGRRFRDSALRLDIDSDIRMGSRHRFIFGRHHH